MVTRAVLTRAALAVALASTIVPGCDDTAGARPAASSPGRAPAPPPGGLRRLLRPEYINSVRVLLGEAAAQAAAPPPDTNLRGFDAMAAVELSLPPSAVDAYEASARAIARTVESDPETLARLLPCVPKGPEDVGCHRRFVTRFGRLAWRRPLVQGEIDRLTGIAQAAARAHGEFRAGVSLAISAFLQSPSFIYLVEIGEPNPEDPASRRLTTDELLARLSFFLLDQTPDAELLDAAGGRELDAADVRLLARTLLRRPEAKAALSSFYGELLRIRDLGDIAKDRNVFPEFTPELALAMTEEVLRLVDDVVWTRNADARELLTSSHSFINEELAASYGLTAPREPGFVQVELPPDQERSGLLSAPAILARFAHADRTSPTRRGLFVRTAVLCEDIEPPPPGVNTTLPAQSSPTSLQAQLEQHMEDPACSGCHALTDPVGFALEHYDAIGAYRTEDNGFPIAPPEREVAGIGSFTSARELGALLHDDPRVPRCMAQGILRNALGIRAGYDEPAAVASLADAFAASHYRVQDLLVELAASPAFMRVGEPR